MGAIPSRGSPQRLSVERTAIDLIIVNWNAGVQIRECVESVLENDPGCIEQIIVIDNASIDGSADVIEKLPKVDVIRAGKNLGFAAACNLGASKGSAPYILFLNPDTRVGANSFLVPHTFMEQVGNDRVGICGIQLVDEQGQVSRTCARFPTLTRLVLQALGVNKISGFRHTGVHITEWDHKRSARVDHVIGAFFLIRRPLFETLGGFDEQFFVYLEDIDLSYRAYNQGYISMYLTEAQAFHAGGGTSSQVKDIRLFYSLRSRLLYGFKHFPIWQAWLLTGVTMVLEPCSRLLYCVIRRDWDGIKHTIQGYRMLWRNLPQVLFGFKPRCG